MTPQEETNRQLVADFWHYWANGERDKVTALLTDDCVFKIGAGKSESVVPYHGTYHGLDEIKRYLEASSRGRIREECIVSSLVAGEVPRPMNQEACPLGLLVQNNTVVALVTIVELFPDRVYMGKYDAILLFRVDEGARKVEFFQLFLDTAASMIAHLNR